MARSFAAILVFVAAGGRAHANVEVGYFAGTHVFSSRSELGVSDGPDAPSQRNSVVFGVRLGVYTRDVVGFEAELGVIPTVARDTGFSVVDFTYRVQVVTELRAKDPAHLAIPFLVTGIGGISVVNSKNEKFAADPRRNIAQDTDPEYFFGLGLKVRAGHTWGARIDARVLAGPSSETSAPSSGTRTITADFEAMVSVYADFDRVPTSHAAKPPDPVADPDRDGDGVGDKTDKCPFDPEDRNGVDDSDGCPETDTDRDGVRDSMDHCPAEAEDKDGFQDSDGCPDPDNDADGILDLADNCRDQPETVNHYRDDDGCPDAVPAVATELMQRPIDGITFRVNSNELTPAAQKALDALAITLASEPEASFEIGVHTDDVPTRSKKYPTNIELSQAQADAVRDYLVAKGIAAARLTAKGLGDSQPLTDPKGLSGRKLTAARAQNRRVQLTAR